MWLLVCFPYTTPLLKRVNSERKEFVKLERKLFPLRVDPFLEVKQTQMRIISLESLSVSLEGIATTIKQSIRIRVQTCTFAVYVLKYSPADLLGLPACGKVG